MMAQTWTWSWWPIVRQRGMDASLLLVSPFVDSCRKQRSRSYS